MPNSEIVLEAVPNVSEGRDIACIEAFGHALTAHGSALLDVHSDHDHNRSVYTLVGGPQEIADSIVAGARTAIQHIDMRVHEGAHPCVGALDVVPIVYLSSGDRELAHDEALAVGNRLAGELDLPVFMYGELASAEERRERAFFREGGASGASARVTAGELVPDFGPARLHPTAGATLVTARPPLVAFNVELDTADVELAKAVAAKVREAGGGLRGVRAIGVLLASRGVAQVSTNVHDPLRVPLREVVEAVRREAESLGARVAGAEIVGLVPQAALDGFPEHVPLNGFDASRHTLERRVRAGPGPLDAPAATQAQASRDPGRHRPSFPLPPALARGGARQRGGTTPAAPQPAADLARGDGARPDRGGEPVRARDAAAGFVPGRGDRARRCCRPSSTCRPSISWIPTRIGAGSESARGCRGR